MPWRRGKSGARPEAASNRERIGRHHGQLLEAPWTAAAAQQHREIPVFASQYPGFSPCEPFSHRTNDWTLLAPFGAYTGLIPLGVIRTISGVPGASGTEWSEPFLTPSQLSSFFSSILSLIMYFYFFRAPFLHFPEWKI